MEIKRKVGRPLKWQTREELIELINLYLDNTEVIEYTVTGLALAIGASRQLLDDYSAREDYGDIIKEAKLIVENAYELSLRKNGRSGDIFALKNFGWRDKQEQEIYGEGGGAVQHNLTVEFVGEAKPNKNENTDSNAV